MYLTNTRLVLPWNLPLNNQTNSTLSSYQVVQTSVILCSIRFPVDAESLCLNDGAGGDGGLHLHLQSALSASTSTPDMPRWDQGSEESLLFEGKILSMNEYKEYPNLNFWKRTYWSKSKLVYDKLGHPSSQILDPFRRFCVQHTTIRNNETILLFLVIYLKIWYLS